ncbi:cell division ATP-binding protein FtsE [Clostridium vitabionis]|jgi:cell division transport system ATP-binding protein|uniref:cell division ATP-binding protein FtsE n=1 Tax=Clostridium vitabionis TaxID=2784388 RepID=UPI00188BEBC5|nr:cell division ATP-binding protein FtsE [Clostridium vitabionis]
MIRLEHVSKVYPSGTKALRDVNIEIRDGEFVFIMGRSGSGKSTLIRLLLKELEPSEGIITVNGEVLGKMRRRSIPRYRREIGVVFQNFLLLRDRNVFENVAFAQRVVGVRPVEILANVSRILELVGLSSRYKALPSQLSGGEQQRTAIARALVNCPRVLLADEPTGNLDAKTSQDIMELLDEINRQGTTVVVVTHSHEIVRKMQKRVIVLDHGQVDREIPEGSFEE